MVNHKKKFIDKKHATTYQLIHRSQRDVAPDHNDISDNNNDNHMLSSDDNHANVNNRMILWPQDRQTHQQQYVHADHDDHNSYDGNTTSNQNELGIWKQRLSHMGLLDETNHEEYIRPMSGTGIYLDARTGKISTPSVTTTTTKKNNNNSTNTVLLSTDDDIMEVQRQYESIPLSSHCMDDEIMAALYDTENYMNTCEEITDDFILFAAGIKDIQNNDDMDDINNDNTKKTNNDNQNNNNNIEAFDFDAHIQQLINTATMGRTIPTSTISSQNDHGANDVDYFSKHWKQPLPNKHFDHNHDSDDEGKWDHDDEIYPYQSSNGMSRHETGVVAILNSDEERALCEKFELTLAEYDNESDCSDNIDDDIIKCKNEDQHTECHDIDSSKFIGIETKHMRRPLVGDAVVEAALDEYINEREDDIYIHGTDRRRCGGSGYSVLIGTQLMNASIYETSIRKNNTITSIEQQHASTVLYPEQEPEIPIDEYIKEAEYTILQPKEGPPPEEIFIDGKSYFSERVRNQWDCESILSTYSNLDNNPITIQPSSSRRRKRMTSNRHDNITGNSSGQVAPTIQDNYHALAQQHIKLSTKTGLPIIESHGDYDDDNDDNFNETIISVNKGLARKKDETLDEKRLRKLVSKRERELARIQKKVTRQVYCDEFQKRAIGVNDDMAGKTVFRFS